MNGFGLLLLAAAVAAREPAERQALADLAYALGEAHALRLVCNGRQDQTWRTQMTRLVELEVPDESFKRRLTESFNAGFATRRAEHPGCDPGVATAERETAERGRALAERLGQ